MTGRFPTRALPPDLGSLGDISEALWADLKVGILEPAGSLDALEWVWSVTHRGLRMELITFNQRGRGEAGSLSLTCPQCQTGLRHCGSSQNVWKRDDMTVNCSYQWPASAIEPHAHLFDPREDVATYTVLQDWYVKFGGCDYLEASIQAADMVTLGASVAAWEGWASWESFELPEEGNP